MINKNKIKFKIKKTIYKSPKFIFHICENINHIYNYKLLKTKKEDINKYINECDIDNLNIFNTIEIETINRCNGICPFCPVNVHDDPRKHVSMTDDLFKKIIEELKNINYSGTLSLYSNNEAFLDKNIISKCKYAKENVPNAIITIWTNATLLTLDKYISVIQYLDKLVIDNYNDNYEYNPNVKIIAEYLETHTELKNKTQISMRMQNQILSTRGGKAPNKSKSKLYPGTSCNLPFQQIIIRPDGKISLCCNDALGVYTLGDVTKQTLIDIWKSETHLNILRELKTNGRKKLELCKNCDFC